MANLHRSYRIGFAFAALVAGALPQAAAAAVISVPLHPLPALSTVRSAATGSAVIDAGTGVVTVEVRDLPTLPAGAAYEVLLVHNVPGPGHSIAIDRDTAGDDIIDAGALADRNGSVRLDASVDPARLAGFRLDLVAVTREQPGVPSEIVIGGLVSILQKLGGAPPPLDMVRDGARVFTQENFDGNGRTCATCHPPANEFTLSPRFIASLPADDPLFVAELNPTLADLENPALMRGPRALILENIDGLDRPPVFRGTPHILNAALTAPYGLSGDVPTLGEFALGAIVQHGARRLDRVPGVDFRLPRQTEIDAIEAFQLSVFAPPERPADLNELLTTEQQRRGRDLFFGSAHCALCHGGPVLATPDPVLGKTTFDTGVVDLPINRTAPAECPSCPPLGMREANGAREFNVPPLVGVARTAPFFHDNSASSLRDAVAFYDGPEFQRSPAGRLVGGVQLASGQIDDIAAFLGALTTCGNGNVDGGEACDDGNDVTGDGCRPDCTLEACGDGIPDPDEACDDGAENGRDRCCSASCQLIDRNGDGVCDRDECPDLAIDATTMDRVKSISVDYRKTGPGGGDDSVRNIGGTFHAQQAIDPTSGDTVRVMLVAGQTGRTVFSATLSPDGWSRRRGRLERWTYSGQKGGPGVRMATLRRIRSDVYVVSLSPVVARPLAEPLSLTPGGLRLAVEIGDGLCATGRLSCARMGRTVDRCTP